MLNVFDAHMHENTRHLIGKELPYTDTLPASTGTASVGISEIPARADHVHSLGTAVLSAGLITAWTSVTSLYTAGWSNYGAPYQIVEYSKDIFGFVHIRGLAKGTNTRSFATMFTLPANHRPPSSLIFPSDRSAAGTPFLHARLDVDSAGNVNETVTGLGVTLDYIAVNISFYVG